MQVSVLHLPTEKKSPAQPPEFIRVSSTYMNGGHSSLGHASPPPLMEPLIQPQDPESQPAPFNRKPSHQLLAVHHTSFTEEEEVEQLVRDHLAERSAELITAGEC